MKCIKPYLLQGFPNWVCEGTAGGLWVQWKSNNEVNHRKVQRKLIILINHKMYQNKTLTEMVFNILFVCLHVLTISNIREPWIRKCDTSLLKSVFSNRGGTSNKNILGERGSDDKKGWWFCEFAHLNVFERQTPSKIMHGEITEWVIIQIKMNVFISWCNVKHFSTLKLFL